VASEQFSDPPLVEGDVGLGFEVGGETGRGPAAEGKAQLPWIAAHRFQEEAEIGGRHARSAPGMVCGVQARQVLSTPSCPDAVDRTLVYAEEQANLPSAVPLQTEQKHRGP